jgi:hypothetical protein
MSNRIHPRRKSQSQGLHLKYLERHPLVLEYDNEGMDTGRVMVTLVKGYAWYDAAKPGEDPEARMACHSRGIDNARDFALNLSVASPCHCGRCTGGF